MAKEDVLSERLTDVQGAEYGINSALLKPLGDTGRAWHIRTGGTRTGAICTIWRGT